MGLTGKGFFIWKIPDAEKGNPTEIAAAAKAAGLTHVLIKIADGSYPYNVNRSTGADLAAPVVQALRDQKIGVWGWHYVYGNSPTGEASIAIRRLEQLNLDGYVIDAEIEYKEPGKANSAKVFLSALRKRFPNLPVALSSYRFPSYHPQFPWKAFLEGCDLHMPQVYWEQAHNAGAQLRRCVRELQALNPARPVIPTGPAYSAGGWSPTPADLHDFFETSKALGLPAVNFFSWDECRARLPALWDTIGAHEWSPQPSAPDIAARLVEVLNSRNPNRVMALYTSFAIHITADRSVQAADAIRSWYATLFQKVLPNATFRLIGSTGTGSTRHFTWAADNDRRQIAAGSDTLGLLNGQIAYHFSSFSMRNE
jgi:hypothetical protein